MSTGKKDWLASWHATPGSGAIYGFLDGIRGIAILMVVASHTLYVNPNATGLVRAVGSFFAAGTIGVTVFFTLSGFLIALPFWKRKVRGESVMPPGYVMRRFWKIYPPLALSVLLLTPIYIMLKGDAAGYCKIALQWLSGVAWLVPVQSKLNPVMWSLVVEVHYYALLPLCFLCLSRVGYKTTLQLLGLGFLVLPPLVKMWYARIGIEWYLHPDIRVCFPVKLDSFAVGIILAGMYANGTLGAGWAKAGPFGMVFLPIVLSHGIIGDMFPGHRGLISHSLIHYGAMLATAGMICFLGDPAQAVRWGLDNVWLRWLGLISYEWYLFHQPMFFWSWRFFGLANGDPVKYLLIVATPIFLSLAIAALVYKNFSLPILRRNRA